MMFAFLQNLLMNLSFFSVKKYYLQTTFLHKDGWFVIMEASTLIIGSNINLLNDISDYEIIEEYEFNEKTHLNKSIRNN